MTRQINRRFSFGCYLVQLFLFLAPGSSTANPNVFISPSTRHVSSWNSPLRIGVRSALLSRRTRATPLLASVSSSAQNQIDTEWDDEENNNEGNVLFPEDGLDKPQGGVTYARSITTLKPTNTMESTTGFRQRLELPAFLSRRNTISVEHEAMALPVVAVSSKVSSFSPTLQNRQQDKARRESTAPNHRKEASSKTLSGGTATLAHALPLVFWENMVCGAVSRSIAQTMMHPANTMKTLLQQSNAPPLVSFLRPSQLPILFRGAGANFILSVPHGAINFAVLEMVRKELGRGVRATKFLADREGSIGPALDFMSSAISTICCSVVSTPQMMITDNIMAGNYKNIPDAVRGIAQQGGIKEFYARGWWPGLVGKIPSYALTWTLFQEMKTVQRKITGRDATNFENSIMGCIASGTTVSIMIPMDTIKTRLVTQSLAAGSIPYKGIVDCAVRVAREEGFKAFYKGLPPRLVSVVPMIGIQFTVYEFMKQVMQKRALAVAQQKAQQQPTLAMTKQHQKKQGRVESTFDPYSTSEILQESCMEVAASQGHPLPAPHFHGKQKEKNGDGRKVK